MVFKLMVFALMSSSSSSLLALVFSSSPSSWKLAFLVVCFVLFCIVV
ncbi:Uncharacterized protein APZ42_010001 [Daphnia magna]|uniref:Uncharacterized protein n=1 Tax=Daphnia magna TaxID=35525 RepID=A0A164DMG3_9CRUS|nr:Uncharacterized protein APZ42_010001 [Daphnia magna]